MKKFSLIFLLLLSAVIVVAQDAYDAWKYAQRDLFGTARYVGMSGAFAALGGDPSAVKDNPAALGVFRKTDVSLTLDLNIERTISHSPDNTDYTGKAIRLSCGQANWIQTFGTANSEYGLVNHSFMFGYHRLKNFDRELLTATSNQSRSITDFLADFSYGLTESQMTNGFQNEQVPWLTVLGYEGYIINPDTTGSGVWSSVLSPGERVGNALNLSESGWIDEINIAWGANLSNKFYFGLNLDMRLMKYSKDVSYAESFEQGGSFTLNTNYRASGVGFNFNAGIIYRPNSSLRLSISAQTPTLMNYKETYNAKIQSWGLTDKNIQVLTPELPSYNYQLTNPWRLTAGVAATFSTRALLSFQYDYEAYHTMHYRANSGNMNAWANENNHIKTQLKDAHTFRVGGEVLITNTFAIRAGYAYKTWFTQDVPNRYLMLNTTRTDTEFGIIRNQHYIGAGLGYRNNLLIADIAYQYRISHESIAPFNDIEPLDFDAPSHRIVFTFGIK